MKTLLGPARPAKDSAEPANPTEVGSRPEVAGSKEHAAASGVPFDIESASTAAKQSMRDIKERLHGQFTITGVPGIKKFVFMPQGEVKEPKSVHALRQFFGLPRPNLVIQTNDNVNPTDALVYQEALDENPELKDLKTLTQLDGEAHLSTVNEFMRNRIQQTLMHMVAAASTTDSWILSKQYPFSNHRAIQQAMLLTNASPTCVAVDNPAAYVWDWNPHADRAATALLRLREAARPWKVPSADLVTIDFPPEALFRHKQIDDFPSKSTDSSNWVWSGADYFVFCVDPELFNDECLGPSGWVMIGGFYKKTRQELSMAIKMGRPCVLIDHTGGETEEVARLIVELNKCVGVQPMVADVMQNAHGLWQHALMGQRRRQRYCDAIPLSLAMVLELIDMHCAVPWLFRERIVVVNPLKDSPTTTLNIISQCFANYYLKAHDIDAGPADRDAVISAWKWHRHLFANAQMHRRRADSIAILSILLTFLASSMAIVSVYVETLEGEHTEWLRAAGVVRIFNNLTVILPAMSTLVSGIIAFGGWLEKWASLYMASHRLVRAIYMFRMRVGPFSISGSSDLSEAPIGGGGGYELQSSGPADRDNVSFRMHRCRARFAAMVQEITEQVMTRDIQVDALEFAPDDTLHEMLEEHVTRAVYGGAPRQLASGGEGDALEGLGSDARAPLVTSVEDDNVSSLSNQDYFKHRVRPLQLMLRTRGPRLNFCYKFLSFLLLTCGSLATALAAFQLKTWLPIAVSAAVVCQSLLTHYNLKQWLIGTTSAVGKLQSLQTRWDSMGTMDQRLVGTRSMLVEACEAVAVQAAASRAGFQHEHHSEKREVSKESEGANQDRTSLKELQAKGP